VISIGLSTSASSFFFLERSPKGTALRSLLLSLERDLDPFRFFRLSREPDRILRWRERERERDRERDREGEADLSLSLSFLFFFVLRFFSLLLSLLRDFDFDLDLEEEPAISLG